MDIRQYKIFNTEDGFVIANDVYNYPIQELKIEGNNLVIKLEHGSDIVFLNLSKTERRELELVVPNLS